MNTAALIEGVLARDPRALARAISESEDRTSRAAAVLRGVYARTGRARVLGVTGAPGAGKSSLVDRLIAHYRRRGHAVAVLAVDPSSPFTGGAILGDRIRMQAHGVDPHTFIRSMATRGYLGGLSRAAGDAIAILDAAGFDPVLVETVGVGQDEVDIARTADVTLLVLVPGMGDDIQTLKAGLMEIGDVFVINKADREGVLRIEQELQALLTLAERSDGWQPLIVKTVATADQGIEELAAAAERYVAHARADARRPARQAEKAARRLRDLLQERLLQAALRRGVGPGGFEDLAGRVAARQLDPYTAVESIMARLNLKDEGGLKG